MAFPRASLCRHAAKAGNECTVLISQVDMMIVVMVVMVMMVAMVAIR